MSWMLLLGVLVSHFLGFKALACEEGALASQDMSAARVVANVSHRSKCSEHAAFAFLQWNLLVVVHSACYSPRMSYKGLISV